MYSVIITWRLCAAVCTGCGSCGSCDHSPYRSWAWTASLPPPFSASWRCTVATQTGGAAPVAKETDRTGGICVEKVGDEFWDLVHWVSAFLSDRGDNLFSKAVKEIGGHQKPPWNNALFTQWITFHLFVYSLWIVSIWVRLFYCCWASDKWMINLLT